MKSGYDLVQELRVRANEVETLQDAQEFLADLSLSFGRTEVYEHPQTDEFISALGGVLSIPLISDHLDGKSAKLLCIAVFSALLYE